MTEDQEREFVNECFNLYEKEGFSKVFWSDEVIPSEMTDNGCKLELL